MGSILRFLCLFASLALAGCATAAAKPAPQPQRQIFVTAANPLAVEAGMNVLRRGGSAVDAAIAVQAMLSLVEPQSSGLGGGAFMTYYDASARRVIVYDGRETAPAGAAPDMFLDPNGASLPFARAVLSGRATGVPGAVRMLHTAHRAHGRLAWRTLFGDAERTARDGFTVSPRLGRMIAARYPQNGAPDVRAYFAEGRRHLARSGRHPAQPRLCRFPPPARRRRGRTPSIAARPRRGSSPASMKASCRAR